MAAAARSAPASLGIAHDTDPTREPQRPNRRAHGQVRSSEGSRVEGSGADQPEPAGPRDGSPWRSTSAQMTRSRCAWPWHRWCPTIRRRLQVPTSRTGLEILPIPDGFRADGRHGSAPDAGGGWMTRWHERAVQTVGVEGGLEPLDRGDELRHDHRTALYRIEHALARLGRSRSYGTLGTDRG